MDDKENLMNSLFERAGELGKTSVELIQLKTVSRSSSIVSYATVQLVVILAIFLFILLLCLGTGLLLGDMLGKMYYGFFIVAASYAVIAVVLYYSLEKRIKKIIRNAIIKQSLN